MGICMMFVVLVLMTMIYHYLRLTTDWQKNITPAEKNLLTHIFRFFTQADVEVSNCYLRHYTTVFKQLKSEMMMNNGMMLEF